LFGTAASLTTQGFGTAMTIVGFQLDPRH